jgi:hypothetical protein
MRREFLSFFVAQALLAAASTASSSSGTMECRADDGTCTDAAVVDDCRLYLAPSSEGGWSLHTAVNVQAGSRIGPADVAIQLADVDRHHHGAQWNASRPWSLANYLWDPVTTGATFDAEHVLTLQPGLAMWADLPVGSVQMEGCKSHPDATSRENPEAGAASHYQDCTFKATQTIPAGSELFAPAGGKKRTVRDVTWLQQNGQCVDNLETRPVPDGEEVRGPRGAFLSSRTAGVKKGDVVSPVPVLPLDRKHLEMVLTSSSSSSPAEREEEGHDPTAPVVLWKGHQLLLNYCYGFTDSSLLFFPYAPAVNLINHDSDNANVALASH